MFKFLDFFPSDFPRPPTHFFSLNLSRAALGQDLADDFLAPVSSLIQSPQLFLTYRKSV